MKRGVQVFGWALIWSGIFVFGYLGWQLLGTDLVNARIQAAAEIELGERFEETRQKLPEVEQFPPLQDSVEKVEYHPEEPPETGTAFAYMTVPSLDLGFVVFEGVEVQTLKQGPAHMPWTPLPGQPGNVVISGHRTTYGRPFFDFDRLEPGNRIEIETAIGTHIYEVRETFIVNPTDVWVTEDRDGGWLTLTTCNPKFSARQRLIITAELVDGPNAEYVTKGTGS